MFFLRGEGKGSPRRTGGGGAVFLIERSQRRGGSSRERAWGRMGREGVCAVKNFVRACMSPAEQKLRPD